MSGTLSLFRRSALLFSVKNGPTAILTKNNIEWPLPPCRTLIIDGPYLKYTSRIPLTLRTVILSPNCDLDTNWNMRNLFHEPQVRNLVYLTPISSEVLPDLKKNENLMIYVPRTVLISKDVCFYDEGDAFHKELLQYLADALNRT